MIPAPEHTSTQPKENKHITELRVRLETAVTSRDYAQLNTVLAEVDNARCVREMGEVYTTAKALLAR